MKNKIVELNSLIDKILEWIKANPSEQIDETVKRRLFFILGRFLWDYKFTTDDWAELAPIFEESQTGKTKAPSDPQEFLEEAFEKILK